MGYWLAKRRTVQDGSYVKRFDARFWTVNFPRPMMASVVTTAPDALRVDAVFYRQNDLAGLIWSAEDRYDHPLLAYETARDFRRCVLRFRWRSAGVIPLDAANGPTLTIEGKDESGAARSWYVRLWNYADGTPEDASISLDFASLRSGFALPGEPVWAGDVDRMFISLAAPGYDGSETMLGGPLEGWAELSDIACDGSGSVLEIGDVLVPPHVLRIASGYDDLYHLTPARVLRNILQLGYRGLINHYVGMSHYFRLEDGLASSAGGALNVAAAAWHADFASKAATLGFELILSLSYELLDQHCPEGWKQRSADGSPALTGWSPPSTLLSPANAEAVTYLKSVAAAFANIAASAGLRVRFQVGEPWWWIDTSGQLCVHDDAALAACGGSVPTDAQAGAMLAASTAALTVAVRNVAVDAELLLLLYLPTIRGRETALAPLAWASPAFDVLQLEDYEWLTGGRAGLSKRAAADMADRLRFTADRRHYFAGFVLAPENDGQWATISEAIERSRAGGAAETFVWALPQVMRDGFTWFDEEKPMNAFADVSLPLAIGAEVSVSALTSTAIASGAGGSEQRNAEWAEARLRFEAGRGVRSEADLAALIAFFRARRGPAQAFRMRDPFDDSSSGMVGQPGPLDQVIGRGDGARTSFPLVKDYDGVERRITRPVAGSVRVAVDGIETAAWSIEDGGVIALDASPLEGAEITAGFRFDVPVRFAEDRLDVNRATFLAGEALNVALIEVRE